MSDYKKAMQIDAQESIKYFNFSLSKKTEQQKGLEKILIERGVAPQIIADIACGGAGQVCILLTCTLKLNSQWLTPMRTLFLLRDKQLKNLTPHAMLATFTIWHWTLIAVTWLYVGRLFRGLISQNLRYVNLCVFANRVA